jgi:hypothetical protein
MLCLDKKDDSSFSTTETAVDSMPPAKRVLSEVAQPCEVDVLGGEFDNKLALLLLVVVVVVVVAVVVGTGGEILVKVGQAGRAPTPMHSGLTDVVEGSLSTTTLFITTYTQSR